MVILLNLSVSFLTCEYANFFIRIIVGYILTESEHSRDQAIILSYKISIIYTSHGSLTHNSNAEDGCLPWYVSVSASAAHSLFILCNTQCSTFTDCHTDELALNCACTSDGFPRTSSARA